MSLELSDNDDTVLVRHSREALMGLRLVTLDGRYIVFVSYIGKPDADGVSALVIEQVVNPLRAEGFPTAPRVRVN